MPRGERKLGMQDVLDQELIGRDEVARMCSITPATVTKLVRRGDLPRPIRFNRRLQRWVRSEVIAAIRLRLGTA